MPMMQINNNHRNNNQNSLFTGIFSVLGIGVIGLALYAAVHVLIFTGLSVYTAVVNMTVPALVKSFLVFSGPALSAAACLQLAAEGLFAGLCIGCVKRLFRKRKRGGAASKSFISELFTVQVFNLKTNLVSSIVLNMLAGFGVGWVAGAGGAAGVSHTLVRGITQWTSTQNIHTSGVSGAVQAAAGGLIDAQSTIGVLISGGGAGGVGGGNTLLWILFILILFIIQGILIGASTGLTFGALFGAVSGAIKTGSLEAAEAALEWGGEKKGRKIFISARKGVLEGAIAGGIVGLLQGIITIIITMPSKGK